MVFILFLPALIELRKPKDAGPRIIGILPAKAPLVAFSILRDIDEEPQLDDRLIENSQTLYFLPNMEAYTI